MNDIVPHVSVCMFFVLNTNWVPRVYERYGYGSGGSESSHRNYIPPQWNSLPSHRTMGCLPLHRTVHTFALKQHEELANLKSEALHLSEDTKLLKETTTKFLSNIIEQYTQISSLTTYFEELLDKMSVRKNNWQRYLSIKTIYWSNNWNETWLSQSWSHENHIFPWNKTICYHIKKTS